MNNAVPLHEDRPRIIRKETRCYPSEINPFGITITIVLVEGNANDYAAYIGHGSPEYVAKHGNKISFKEAQACFGEHLEKEKYRY